MPLDADTFRSPVMTFTTRHGLVDVLRETFDVGGYDELLARSATYDVLGMRISVIDLDDLIKDKEAAGRDRDVAKLPQLRALRAVLREREQDG